MQSVKRQTALQNVIAHKNVLLWSNHE